VGTERKQWWQRLLSRLRGVDPLSPEEIEQLRAAFQNRFNSFRLLLTANNRALEIMAEMERALDGTRPLDMAFIRTSCTRVAAQVLTMIGHLERIAPEKYDLLDERFEAIQGRIEAVLGRGELDEDLPLVRPFAGLTAAEAGQVGAKMALLAELGSAGIDVPSGFVTTTRAHRMFFEHGGLEAEINRLIQTGGVREIGALAETSRRIRELVLGAEVPGELAEALGEGYRALEREVGAGVTVVMRSSALGEDEVGASHAGMYESVLGVTADNLLPAFKTVLASKFSARAIRYRLDRGIRDDDVLVCAGCLVLVEASASGVAYTASPIDPEDDSLIIHSTWGLPHPVVHGSAETDVFVVARGAVPAVAERRAARKPTRQVYSRQARGCVSAPNDELADQASLTDEQVLLLARRLLDIEAHFGSPQDVEWALTADGSLTVLQSRPLARRAAAAPLPGAGADPRELGRVLLEGGETASAGAGAGPVVRVRSEGDLNGFPAGGVLVAHQSSPDWAVVLDRAAAVVTEYGGVVGHLASVARELGVPALFGLSGAVAGLEPGRLVTVDAGRRVVLDGRIEGALERRAPVSPIVGSSVHRTLDAAARHIVTLNLLDPEAAAFKPASCETLHDITRFCHEVSVREMFRFGKENRFPERSSRQLKCEVPMQFWIIDLADGLDERDPDPKYVRFEDIVSIPMLALWRGMNALVWEGPPPVDAKGFMDVVLQTATNPWLSPAMPSAFSVKNYFMISKSFCSMQSRFGYHLAGIEALVGPRAMENYAAFQFTSGGAGPERTARRARLIADILLEMQFRAEAVRDSVRARIEGYPQEFMERRLALLGFLMIHTRQLDMAMVDEAAAAAHKRKLLDQIEQLSLAGPAPPC